MHPTARVPMLGMLSSAKWTQRVDLDSKREKIIFAAVAMGIFSVLSIGMVSLVLQHERAVNQLQEIVLHNTLQELPAIGISVVAFDVDYPVWWDSDGVKPRSDDIADELADMDFAHGFAYTLPYGQERAGTRFGQIKPLLEIERSEFRSRNPIDELKRAMVGITRIRPVQKAIAFNKTWSTQERCGDWTERWIRKKLPDSEAKYDRGSTISITADNMGRLTRCWRDTGIRAADPRRTFSSAARDCSANPACDAFACSFNTSAEDAHDLRLTCCLPWTDTLAFHAVESEEMHSTIAFPKELEVWSDTEDARRLQEDCDETHRRDCEAPAGNCQDLKSDCSYWKRKGYCTHTYVDFMNENCCASCCERVWSERPFKDLCFVSYQKRLHTETNTTDRQCMRTDFFATQVSAPLPWTYEPRPPHATAPAPISAAAPERQCSTLQRCIEDGYYKCKDVKDYWSDWIDCADVINDPNADLSRMSMYAFDFQAFRPGNFNQETIVDRIFESVRYNRIDEPTKKLHHFPAKSWPRKPFFVIPYANNKPPELDVKAIESEFASDVLPAVLQQMYPNGLWIDFGAEAFASSATIQIVITPTRECESRNFFLPADVLDACKDADIVYKASLRESQQFRACGDATTSNGRCMKDGFPASFVASPMLETRVRFIQMTWVNVFSQWLAIASACSAAFFCLFGNTVRLQAPVFFRFGKSAEAYKTLSDEIRRSFHERHSASHSGAEPSVTSAPSADIA